MITAYFFSFLLCNHLSTIKPGIFLVSNAMLNINYALITVWVGTFVFSSENKINQDRCSIANGDCRIISVGNDTKSYSKDAKSE